MSKNLNHELASVIIDAFHEGMDKHAAPREERRGKIYSYTTKRNLLKFKDNLCEWIKVAHPEVYHLPPAKAMTAELAREFLESKRGVCSQKTLDMYRSQIAKIGIMISKQAHTKVDLSVQRIMSVQDVPKTARGADDIPTQENMEKLMAYAKAHPSRSGAAILLQRFVGIRVSEMSYRIHIDGNVLKVTGKGNKRYPDMPITPGIAKLLNSAEWKSKILEPDGWFNFPKPESINTYLRRTHKKLGIEHHSFHALRRYHATEHYNRLRINGADRGEAIKQVNLLLNHGADRGEKLLRESYVKDLW